MSWRATWGLLRSRAIYYWKPGNLRAMRRFYGDFIRHGDLCFDIGSHLGNRVAVWRDLGARVVAVEPQPTCQAFLQRKFGRDPEVTLLSWAIGPEPGQALLHINSNSPSISTLRGPDWRDHMASLSSRRETWDRQVEVPVRTLESLIADYGIPAFCKLDIEGYELEAMKGLHTPLPHLSFEFLHPGLEGVADILDQLARLGTYRYRFSLRERHRFSTPQDLNRDALMDALYKQGGQVISGDIYARISS